MRSLFSAIAVMLAPATIATTAPAPVPGLFAFCVEMGLPKVTPRPLAEQAALLKTLGYDGIACALWLDGSIDANLKILDDAGMPLRMAWASINLNPEKGPAFGPELPDAIRKLKGRPTILAILLGGLKPADPRGVEPAIRAMRELADIAANVGLRISIYNHVNNWAESLPFIASFVPKIDRPNVGFNFNLCHWLKVEGDRDYAPFLRGHADKLFCVTINGANAGANAWTNGLIQPLDKGNFDNRRLLAQLDEIGYKGAVGLMCFGVPDDPGDHLARSMATWKSWHAKRP